MLARKCATKKTFLRRSFSKRVGKRLFSNHDIDFCRRVQCVTKDNVRRRIQNASAKVIFPGASNAPLLVLYADALHVPLKDPIASAKVCFQDIMSHTFNGASSRLLLPANFCWRFLLARKRVGKGRTTFADAFCVLFLARGCATKSLHFCSDLSLF